MVIKQKHHDYYNSFSRVYIGCKKEDGKKVKKKKHHIEFDDQF